MSEPHVYTVTELNAASKRMLEERFGEVWVHGEISNLSIASSGHAYFVLKDDTSEIAAVRFRSRLPLAPGTLENGLDVLAYGRLTVYEPRGRYQLVASLVEPAGRGAAQRAFEQLKRALQAEGLFDEAVKQPLPALPHRIAVVTSPTGAALRDVCSVLERRWPAVELVVFASAVQGEAAATELVQALHRAERLHREGTPMDAVVITRGGGSLEDLAPFNDERLARAVHACSIPVVSAVGHEVDVTITDLVADRRAPTPSAAAEMIVPDRIEVEGWAAATARSLSRTAHITWRRAAETLRRHAESYVLRVPLRRVEAYGQRLDHATAAVGRSARLRLQQIGTALDAARQTIALLDPDRPLRRGYALCFPVGGKEPLQDAASVARGSLVSTRLHRGELVSEVKEVIQRP